MQIIKYQYANDAIEETICMECQSLFSVKNMIFFFFKMSSADFFIRHVEQ